ncbi:hypothetical protein SUGI_0937990 [Cryptomeria japonica]|nr:hypothetical protein SUGI_0937990 [Cryptomeria japonica]
MASIWLIGVVAFLAIIPAGKGDGLSDNFYGESCPSAEATIQRVVEKYMAMDRTLAAPLLRMNFHDCFVRGCDGSVLLNSTANNKAEKEAIPNQSLRGFNVIDDVKEEVEKICPGVVSCADIIALVARDAVVVGSGGPSWSVKTGRRDGVISREIEASNNIPSPFFNFSQLQNSFASKGLDVKDLTVLSGGHTIGVGLCNFFSNRLYNFTGKGDMDPSLNTTYAQFLKTKCPNLADNTTIVPMDPSSPLTFDNHYYTNLAAKMGLFQSDAALLTNYAANGFVDEQFDQDCFFENFKNSMQKMIEVQVLTGTAGQIRRQCAFVN